MATGSRKKIKSSNTKTGKTPATKKKKSTIAKKSKSATAKKSTASGSKKKKTVNTKKSASPARTKSKTTETKKKKFSTTAKRHSSSRKTTTGAVTQANQHVARLKESIDISSIKEFYKELNVLGKKSTHLVIDAVDVKSLDTAALQLLCIWYKDVKRKGIEVKWKNIDGVFYSSAKLLGVTEHLALD